MEELKNHIYDETNGLHYTLLATITSPTWNCRKSPAYWDLGADAQGLFGAVPSSPVQ